MTAAFTFPGQGSQTVGMGKALAEAFPAAKAVFDEVDAALGEKLSHTIWDGPAETLQLTENAQPALMAVSLATLRVLESEAGFSVERDAAFVAGHSLGEYSALAAAGSLTISDTARLLRTRGLAMQKAVPVGAGAMAALLGLDYEAAMAVAHEAAQGDVCQAANDNGGGQVVVSGDKVAVDRAVEVAKAKGAKRALLLPVSAPFHCKLMQPAADAMAEALSMFDLSGRKALVTGATGGIGGAIAQALHAQGATVAISGTRKEVLDELAGKLGERAIVLPCNLSKADEVEALVPAAEAAMGQVDILVD